MSRAMKGSLLRRKQQVEQSPCLLKLPIAAAVVFLLAAGICLSYSSAISAVASILAARRNAVLGLDPLPPASSTSPAATDPAAGSATTPTLRGDNLLPTPWHPFKHPPAPEAEKLARIQCTIKSCSSSSPRSRYPSPNTTGLRHCPSFFQWIHYDLQPWRKAGGITPALLDRAKRYAAMRIVISAGKLYTELYYHCVQSRALFTVWGLLLLLDRFPGQVPDVEFMFNCMDRPHLNRSKKRQSPPPPLVAYCTSKQSYDLPFPDWSYWGWAEVNIGSWDQESAEVFRVSNQTPWLDKRPSAHWKGNPHVGARVRTDLLKCNKTIPDAAEVYVQDWRAEARQGYQNSKLSEQCAHRYKIYAEGHAWSVSFKYIMACGSTLLMIGPEYHDFFMRALLPMYHYWPVDRNNLCSSLQAAVEWGNKHPDEAEEIGRKGQDFLRNELSMEHVYDYMLHFLQEYANLQTFKPVVPDGAQLVCKESILCMADPVQKKFLHQSLQVLNGSTTGCRMPPPNYRAIDKFKSQESRGFAAVQQIERAAENRMQTRTVLKKKNSQRHR